MREFTARVLARAVHLTHLIDHGYRRFDRLRSAAVVAFGSDRFFDHYNAIAYAHEKTYRPDSTLFRSRLFDWETAAIDEFFPSLPARVLIGGAGGGREALALAEKGYSVVAFDPAEGLVNALREQVGGGGQVRAYYGSYATLPSLVDPAGRAPVDLAGQAPFDASILGWASFSHLRNDAERVETLHRFSQLTKGPILVSYYPPLPPGERRQPRSALERWIRGRMARRGHSVFSIDIGYYRLLAHDEMAALVATTGLRVLQSNRTGVWPYFVVEGIGARGKVAAAG